MTDGFLPGDRAEEEDATLPPTPIKDVLPPPPPPPPRGSSRRRALPRLVLLLVVALAAATVITLEAVATPAPERTAAAVPQEPASAGVWYCPVTAEEGQSAVLSVATTTSEPSEVVVVRHTPEGAIAGATQTVDPGTQLDVALDDVQAQQPVSVRWSGGPSTATWRAEGDRATAAPCASGPSPSWYVAGLDTAGGSSSTLHLFNPFATDAVANLTFTSPQGPEIRVTTTSQLVEAGTSREIQLTDVIPEVGDLGAVVQVQTGRLVVQGEVTYAPLPGADGLTGRTLVPAAERPADTWAFGYAAASEQSSSWLSIMNPNDREAAVELQVSDPAAEGEELLREVPVPAGGTTRVDLADVSEAEEFGVAVVVVNDVPVVVTRTSTFELEGDRRGVASSLGAAPGGTWALPGGLADGWSSQVNVYNPGVRPVTVSIAAGEGTPADWGAVEVPVNARVAVDLSEVATGRSGIAAVVTAEGGGVVAELRSQADEDALRPWTEVGVPAVRWTGPPTRPPVRRESSLATTPMGVPGQPSPSPSP